MSPDSALLRCPGCRRPVARAELETHLRRELGYFAWECARCRLLFCTLKEANLHYEGPFSTHRGLSERIVENPEPEKLAELWRLFSAAGGGKGDLAVPPTEEKNNFFNYDKDNKINFFTPVPGTEADESRPHSLGTSSESDEPYLSRFLSSSPEAAAAEESADEKEDETTRPAEADIVVFDDVDGGSSSFLYRRREERGRAPTHPVWRLNGGCMTKEKDHIRCNCVGEKGTVCDWRLRLASRSTSTMVKHVRARHARAFARLEDRIALFKAAAAEERAQRGQPARTNAAGHPIWSRNGGPFARSNCGRLMECAWVRDDGHICRWNKIAAPRSCAMKDLLAHVTQVHKGDSPTAYAEFQKKLDAYSGFKEMKREVKGSQGLC